MSEDSTASERLAEYARRTVVLEARVSALEEELSAARSARFSEQLLADLKRLTYKGTPYHIREPARLRVRALLGLPEEDEDE
jgi:hypothetical protein